MGLEIFVIGFLGWECLWGCWRWGA